MTHLWEVEHSYYCSDSNYYVGNFHGENHGRVEYDTWEEFLQEWSHDTTDKDYNLLFRWDWKRPDPDDYDPEFEEVPEHDSLHLFFILQRKGNFLPVIIHKVTADQEQEVIDYLRPYKEHLMTLWEPI